MIEAAGGACAAGRRISRPVIAGWVLEGVTAGAFAAAGLLVARCIHRTR